jgi:hypothetical protein
MSDEARAMSVSDFNATRQIVFDTAGLPSETGISLEYAMLTVCLEVKRLRRSQKMAREALNDTTLGPL